jgi:hypothetical protein
MHHSCHSPNNVRLLHRLYEQIYTSNGIALGDFQFHSTPLRPAIVFTKDLRIHHRILTQLVVFMANLTATGRIYDILKSFYIIDAGY